MAKISVIVPAYNCEKYLDACIESIVGQTYTDLEIILVDDGSSDGTAAICDRWAERDGRVKAVHRPNGGVSLARNTGLSNVTGELIAFVDSDDLTHPEMLRRLYTAMTEDGSDIAVCSFERFSSPDEIKAEADEVGERVVRPASDTIADCSLLPRSELWGKLYRARVFEGLSFREGYVYEDTYLMPYIYFKAGKISLLPEKMYYYRTVEVTSIMHSAISERKFCVFPIYREHISLYTRMKMPIPRGYIRRAIVPKMMKASYICGKDLRGRFYREFFKCLPFVIFAPFSEMNLKSRLLYISSAFPIKPIRAHYEKISEFIHLEDRNNF